MLSQASHWTLTMEVEKAPMKKCNDLQCSITAMQRKCHQDFMQRSREAEGAIKHSCELSKEGRVAEVN
ncbi:hypothetical protein MRB53_002407 [Persea americana]|uniref:Uncharacterized protein n=1 Tax=Persea americana TaxID=3435 RepID=A0ACC2MUM5_PERAE|nr:hypothetical protein MRB53_002407 [Persea americana]